VARLRDFELWIEQQTARSTAAMEQAISATHLYRRRESFRQIINPAVGSVLASPVIADWDPQPDYFFHWIRDSALVMRTVAELMEAAADEADRRRWQRHFDAFVRFSLNLTQCDGRAAIGTPGYQFARTRPEATFLRPEAELTALGGDALFGEPRFNPDGTIDIFRWSRPQYDGPALRALACLRYLAAGGRRMHELDRLLRLDLDFTMRHAGEPCIGPWEEPGENTFHYYVALVQLGALVHARLSEPAPSPVISGDSIWHGAEQKLRDGLEQHWSERHQILIAMRPATAETADDLLDAASLLAVWDAELPDGPHSVADIRVQKTQAAIERLFARELSINRDRAHAPVIGRSRRDRYFGGGAWYPTTLADAGLYYRLARRSAENRSTLIERGDAIMETLRALTPTDGALSEQIDRDTGKQSSAQHLTWSYAAFISTARQRSLALARQ
jgi:glucoamylase